MGLTLGNIKVAYLKTNMDGANRLSGGWCVCEKACPPCMPVSPGGRKERESSPALLAFVVSSKLC